LSQTHRLRGVMPVRIGVGLSLELGKEPEQAARQLAWNIIINAAKSPADPAKGCRADGLVAFHAAPLCTGLQ
jgi:hypothetical protein